MPEEFILNDFASISQEPGRIEQRELTIGDNTYTATVLKNRLLMSPGTWKEKNYDTKEVTKAYELTDWYDKDILSLYGDHKDQDIDQWKGFIENPKEKDGDVYGDLVIVDDTLSKKLLWGARFGISPKLIGEQEEDNVKDFHFLNFSVVVTPAVKTTFLNSEDKNEINKQTKSKMELEDITKSLAEIKEKLSALETTKEKEPEVKETETKIESFSAEDITSAIANYTKFLGEYLEAGYSLSEAKETWDNYVTELQNAKDSKYPYPIPNPKKKEEDKEKVVEEKSEEKEEEEKEEDKEKKTEDKEEKEGEAKEEVENKEEAIESKEEKLSEEKEETTRITKAGETATSKETTETLTDEEIDTKFAEELTDNFPKTSGRLIYA